MTATGQDDRSDPSLSVSELLDVAASRESAADERDAAANARDASAGRRDTDADARDSGDRAADQENARAGEDGPRERGLRRRAAKSRGHAAGDREHAALDRKLDRSDRGQSARDRDSDRVVQQAMRDELRDAGVDELTGARRRGAGLKDAERELARVRRTGGQLVAAFVDVDDLKGVNDRHGHRAGDELLREVVARLMNDLRPYDLVVRVGGDEFVCLLTDVTLTQARERFERLQTACAASNVGGFSVGWCELVDPTESLSELIDCADRDLLDARGGPRA